MVIPRKPSVREGIRRDYTSAPQITQQYLLGLMHDGTTRKNTLRIASKSLEFCSFLRNQIKKMGSNAWVYREGKSRNLWIIEFSKIFLIETKVLNLYYLSYNPFRISMPYGVSNVICVISSKFSDRVS